MEPLAVAVVIPTLNEAQSIAGVVAEIPRDLVHEIIVVDGGSSDGTQAAAAAAGATRRHSVSGRGYGRACAAGVAAAAPECGIIVFMDGDGADRGDLMARLVDPIRRGDYDFVIASRARGERGAGLDELASSFSPGTWRGSASGRSMACATPICAPIAPFAATVSSASACAR